MIQSRLKLHLLLLPCLLTGQIVAQEEASQQVPSIEMQCNDLQHTQEIHLQIEALCRSLWTQLSALKSAEEADLLAPSFVQSAEQLSQLDRELRNLESNQQLSAASKLFMEQNGNKIIELYILLGNEFNQIYQANCLDSPLLQQAFALALRNGFFYVSTNQTQEEEEIHYFTEEEEQVEIARLQALYQPDQNALQSLTTVQDEMSAQRVAQELSAPITQLHKLRPQTELAHHQFRASSKNLFVRITHPLELTLWNIRNEYVRIASNFATQSTNFNNLANTLDELYLSLEETHYPIFAIVFDASFLADMDAAYDKQNSILIPSP